MKTGSRLALRRLLRWPDTEQAAIIVLTIVAHTGRGYAPTEHFMEGPK